MNPVCPGADSLHWTASYLAQVDPVGAHAARLNFSGSTRLEFD